jgi:dynein heavy chain
MVSSICKLLEAMLVGDIKGLEYIFVFACVWCLGAGFAEKDGHDYRKEFSNWWKDKWKTIKFQSKGTVYDYYVDIENTRLDEWAKLNNKDIDSLIDTSKAISSFTVPTPDTISAQFLMKKFLNVNHSPLLVGNAGCGKTQIIKGLLYEMTTTTDDYLSQIINFNYYTDSGLLQSQLESLLEKKAGRTFAPFGKFKLIQFIDDLNMPMLDQYATQSAIALLRQHKDYEHWYDRAKLSLKDIKNTLYVSSMNPTAGSFFVNPRLQRWFWTLAVPFPEQSSLNTIYAAFLSKHFSKFKGSISE